MLLSYKSVAKKFEEAFPIGNGSTGVMVYGGIGREKLSFNEDTLWSGVPKMTDNPNALLRLPEIRSLIFEGKVKEAQNLLEKTSLGDYSEAYMPLGNLYINFRESFKKNYERYLDTSSATAYVKYNGKNSDITRKYFCSYADKCTVARINSTARDINLSLDVYSPLRSSKRVEGNDTIILEGIAPDKAIPNYVVTKNHVRYTKLRGMAFALCAKVLTDGELTLSEGTPTVTDASYVDIIIVTGTGFKSYNLFPESNAKMVSAYLMGRLEGLSMRSVDELEERHLKDFKSEFNRFSFVLGNKVEKIYLAEELKKVKRGEYTPELISAYVEFAKMLILTGSRKGTQPTNLQGIWNESTCPPWSSNYTVNINTQMNYWLQNKIGFFDCYEPFEKMLVELSEAGADTAEKWYGVKKAFCCNHNTDIWRKTTPVKGYAGYAFYPSAGGWLATHLYDYYEYTMDKSYLEKNFPVLEKAVRFELGWLVEHDGYLTVCPSTSPENSYYSNGETVAIGYGSAHELSIAEKLFRDYVNASRELGINTPILEQVINAIPRLQPLKVTEDGCLAEWDCPYEEKELGHRHLSHLVGFFPFDNIRYYRDEEKTNAVSNALRRRMLNGGAGTGWSAAWVLNLYARLHDAESAEKMVRRILASSTYPNLFDAHPPFQIDGNYGGAAGILEMLAQSEDGIIELMPALPDGWVRGEVKNLRLKGGYSLDMVWWNGEIGEVFVSSDVATTVTIRYNGQIKTYNVGKEKVKISL